MAALDGIRLAVEAAGAQVQEMEINPLVFAGKWIPVDALVLMKSTDTDTSSIEPFPMANLKKGLNPKRTAIIGVSQKMNIGRNILRSMLDGGYPKGRISIIRDGVKSIDGVSCVSSVSHIQKDVDLLIVAVAATRVPNILADAFESKKIRAVLLIPDGMAKGTKSERKVRALITQHARPNRPVVIGNNSLGFVSKKARFDALFVPKEKLPRGNPCTNPNVALISQSGAFMATTLNKLSFLCPAYQISIGNQLDARMSHYLEVLSTETDITTLALYIEGLKKDDGLKIAKLVKKIVGKSSGNDTPKRDVIIYKAGRSDLGQTAAMGHTAAVAGNWRVFRTVMRDAGAMVAETFDDFLGLVRLSSSIGSRSFSGRRTAMMTNAGCEAVGMADNHQADSHTLIPATFSERTTRRLNDILKAAQMDKLVHMSNPLDLTPMANDALHNACMRTILDDRGVDVALFGCAPFTSAIQSLSRHTSDQDAFDAHQSYANLTIDLFNKTRKPFVVVISAGRDYDAMISHLEQAGVPVFRSADEATRILGFYIDSKTKAASSR
jgi:acyl-CoA synthetase (NDP forming)